MLSLFPTLLAWQELSPLLIRLTLAIVMLFWAYEKLRKQPSDVMCKLSGLTHALVGILLICGLWTQLMAMIVAIYMVVNLAKKISSRAFLTDGVNYYLILLVLALSLIVTGAGFLAFDIPL